MSNNDLILNFEKWNTGTENNILYITGLSGSGKTTLAEKYAKEYDAYLFEIDGIQHAYDSSNLELLKSAEEKFPRYLEIRNAIKSGQLSKQEISNLQNEATTQYSYVFEFIWSEIKKDTEKLLIVEGIQLFQWIPIEFFDDKPLIIKQTGAITSMIRAMKRNGNGKIHWISELQNDFPQWIHMYIRHTKNLNEFKKKIVEQESIKYIKYI